MRETVPHLCVSVCIGGLSITAKERIERKDSINTNCRLQFTFYVE